MNKRNSVNLVFLLAIVGVFVGLKVYFGRHADVPAYFDTSRTLHDALAASEASGKPVLALVSADWCGPCQGFKRGALSDQDVSRWIAANTEPVYIDVTSPNNPDAAELGVRSIPAVVLIDERGELSRVEGAMSASSFLGWADGALAGGVSSTD